MWSSCISRSRGQRLVLVLVGLGCLSYMVKAYLGRQSHAMVLRDSTISTTRMVTCNTSADSTGSCNNKTCAIPHTTLVPRIADIFKSLHRAKTHVRGTKTSDSLQKAMKILGGVLRSMQVSPQEVVARPVLPPENVCPEEYKGALYDYPMYHHGFEPINCPFSKHLSKLITVVTYIKAHNLDSVQNGSHVFLKPLIDHSNVTIRIATNHNIEKQHTYRYPKTVNFVTIERQNDGAVWNTLVSHVTTPYVLIARDAELITEDARLERLVREIEMLQVPVAAGAVRYPDGHWKKGCYQSVHRNFTLRYLEGYDESMHECLFCDYIDGPFVSTTEFLKSVPFDESEMGDCLFEDWFLKNKKSNKEAIVCPDSMFHVSHTTTSPNCKAFMAKWDIYKHTTPHGQTATSQCSASGREEDSKLPSPCRLQTNADAVKFVMNMCETNHLFCELRDGTLLGSVKLQHVLPWEEGVTDVAFMVANISQLRNLSEYVKSNNFQVHDTSNDKFILGFLEGRLDMVGQVYLDSQLLTTSGTKPTRVQFGDGWWLAPRNPGLAARNQYGHEMYQHALHWTRTGSGDAWSPYVPRPFPPCTSPGDQDCLDRYNADGNIQFSEPLP